MGKPRYEQLDAHGWFDRADHFHYSALRLSIESNQFIYARPHIVLKAFAAECYLKSLLELEGTKPDRVHDLLSLFDKLSKDSQGRIAKWWNKKSKPILDGARKNAPAEAEYKPPKSLRGALSESATAFLDWRYHGKEAYIGFSILAFPHFVRNRILELKPEWAHKPPHPLAFLNPEPEFVESKDKGLGGLPPGAAVLNPKSASFEASLRAWRGPNPEDRGPGQGG
jgi:hypothetical protein